MQDEQHHSEQFVQSESRQLRQPDFVRRRTTTRHKTLREEDLDKLQSRRLDTINRLQQANGFFEKFRLKWQLCIINIRLSSVCLRYYEFIEAFKVYINLIPQPRKDFKKIKDIPFEVVNLRLSDFVVHLNFEPKDDEVEAFEWDLEYDENARKEDEDDDEEEENANVIRYKQKIAEYKEAQDRCDSDQIKLLGDIAEKNKTIEELEKQNDQIVGRIALEKDHTENMKKAYENLMAVQARAKLFQISK